jgi:hypothetical protein
VKFSYVALGGTRFIHAQQIWPGQVASAELESAVFCPDIRLEYVDDFTEAMLKAATDGTLLLMFARWNR